MNAIEFEKFLIERDACEPGKDFARGMDLQECYAKICNPTWLSWLIWELGYRDKKLWISLAKAVAEDAVAEDAVAEDAVAEDALDEAYAAAALADTVAEDALDEAYAEAYAADANAAVDAMNKKKIEICNKWRAIIGNVVEVKINEKPT